jgi:hypothetical protein
MSRTAAAFLRTACGCELKATVADVDVARRRAALREVG